MTKFLLLTVAFCIALSSSAQFKGLMQKKANVIAPMNKTANIDSPIVGEQPGNDFVSNTSVLDDPVTCVTRYDMQTNSSNQRRIYVYPDGTIGTTATWSQQDALWTDRGTGYNYFDGTSWGAQPASRVESIKTGWPEYHPFGPAGELIIAHQALGNLVMNTRPVKGTGSWTQSILPSLPGNITGMLWPRAVTNGTDHTNIHIIALTMPVANGGELYNGMDGALLYCHSLDGGATWSDWVQLPGMTSADYTGFSADIYAFAEPVGNTLAFTAGDSWQDQFLMKSTDNGTAWTKTVIYNSPYNLGGVSGPFFYCPDGTMSVALDNQEIAHVVFGLSMDSGYRTAPYYKPYTQGIVYWNEHMPQLRQDLDPDSLFTKGQYVAWVKDTMVFYPPSGVSLTTYFTSLTSNPELVIKDNLMALAWAGATLLVDPHNYTLRHIFGRGAIITPAGDVYWCADTILDITDDFVQYEFAECMYPSSSPTISSPGESTVLFQKDDYGGSYIKNLPFGEDGQTFPDNNSLVLAKWFPCWLEGIDEKSNKPTFAIGQNIPNPFKGLTKVNVYMQNPGDLSLEVSDMTGKTLMNLQKTNVLPGVNEFVIDGSQLSSGVYFYTVRQGDQRITKKMVVE